MTTTGGAQRNWSKAELETVRWGIRQGLMRREIAALLPDRTYGAVGDKILYERRAIGISMPKGRPRSDRITQPSVPVHVEPIWQSQKEAGWADMCREGSAQLLAAMSRYYENRRRKMTPPRERFAAERMAKKARLCA
jgi:hypothetical protein